MTGTFDTAVADAMLKIVFQDPLFDSVVTHSQVIDLYEQNDRVQEGPQGRFVQRAHMFGYNEGIGARSENAFLPLPGTPTFVNAEVRLKKTLAIAQMTRNVMANAVKTRAAFADWAEVELDKTVVALRADLDRQVIAFGAGILARVDDAAPDTTLGIDSPYGQPFATKGWQPGIRRGMRIVFGPNSDGSALRDNGKSATILSVDKNANLGGGELTLDALPSGVLDNDFIFRGDDLGNNAPEDGVEVEMVGLLGQIDDGTIVDTYQNISRTTFPEWRSQFVDASVAPFSGNASELLVMRLSDDASELGGGEPDFALMSTGVWRNLFTQIRTQLGFGSLTGPENFIGGAKTGRMKGIKYWIGDRSIELRAVPKWPLGRMVVVDTSTLYRYHLSGFEWDDLTGSIWKQVGVGQGIKDAWFAYGRTEMELGNIDPQKSAFATGLDES